MIFLADMTDPGKKMVIVCIARILLRDSEADNPLSQQEILRLLEEEYGLVVDRKTIRRNLLALRDGGLPVVCREVDRVIEGKSSPLSLDWYWDHDLTKNDIRTLIDLLYFSRLPSTQVKQISEKLKRLHIRSFNDGKEAVRNIPAAQKLVRPEENLSALSDALAKKMQIRFFYDHYEADGKKHHRKNTDGTDKLYTVNPYVLVATDDRYFFLGNTEGTEEVTSFAVELIAAPVVTDVPARPQKTIRGVENGVRVLDYLTPARRTYEGTPEACILDADSRLMTDIVADFGKAAYLISATQERVKVEVTAPVSLIRAWVLKNAPLVKATSPVSLVKSIKEAASALARLYGGG